MSLRRFFKNLMKSVGKTAISVKRAWCENKSVPSHEWFMCMWTSGKRKKLQKCAELYDAVIVLGWASATETIRDAVKSSDCKMIEGMEVAGIMNAQMKFHLPGKARHQI